MTRAVALSESSSSILNSGSCDNLDYIAVLQFIIFANYPLGSAVDSTYETVTDVRMDLVGKIVGRRLTWDKIGIRQYLTLTVSKMSLILDRENCDKVQFFKNGLLDAILNPC